MSPKVYVANFGERNFAWPECRDTSSIAVMDDEDLHPFWERRDKPGYVGYATTRLRAPSGRAVTAAVASRWYALNDILHGTDRDL